jgi:hypothetical protein
LIREDWLDAGHRFAERSAQGRPLINQLQFARPGYDSDALSSWLASLTKPSLKDSGLDHWCPIFPQFLDCLAQLIHDNPTFFEYTQSHLWAVYQEWILNANGLFTGNCQEERSRSPPFSLAWNQLFDTIPDSNGRIEATVIIPDADQQLQTIFKCRKSTKQ